MTTTHPAARSYLRHDRSLWRRALLRTDTALGLALVAVVVWATVAVPYFAQPYTYSTLLLNSAPLLLMVLPVTLIIVTGEIDLSVGSVLGVSSALLGLLFSHGMPLVGAAAVSVLAGVLIGAFNGFMVAVVGLPSLAVTIGTLALFRGVAVGMLGTTAVTGFPGEAALWLRATVGGTPVPRVLVGIAVLAVLFGVLLHATTFGRGVFAIGLSSETALFSGIAVNRTKMLLFIASGTVAALTGVLYTLIYSNAIGSNGIGLELQVVTAIVLGGVSIWGGRGTLAGAIIGALLIGTLSKALQLLNVGSDVISVITGGALILSVVVASAGGLVSRRRRSTPTAPKNGG
ncbi:MAG: ABC transporter permease [Nocardioidaceae bacterium]